MTLPDRFYPIFETADWVARGLAAGARFIQLRIKELEGPDLEREIGGHRRICVAAGATLVVNDHWREAIAAGAPSVHLGQEDLAAADLPAIRAAGLRLGLSTHDEAELATALAARPDYVALGPVFPTILKKMKWAPQGYARLAEWKARIGDAAARRDRRLHAGARRTRLRGGGRLRLRRHRHHAQRRPGGAHPRVDRRDPAGRQPKDPA